MVSLLSVRPPFLSFLFLLSSLPTRSDLRLFYLSIIRWWSRHRTFGRSSRSRHWSSPWRSSHDRRNHWNDWIPRRSRRSSSHHDWRSSHWFDDRYPRNGSKDSVRSDVRAQGAAQPEEDQLLYYHAWVSSSSLDCSSRQDHDLTSSLFVLVDSCPRSTTTFDFPSRHWIR